MLDMRCAFVIVFIFIFYILITKGHGDHSLNICVEYARILIISKVIKKTFGL